VYHHIILLFPTEKKAFTCLTKKIKIIEAKKEEKPKKKPAAAVSALKEALAKANKQEEDLIRAEEEKIRKEEELRKQKLEQERLEKERKDKKKQKEKERIARKKQEGTYETKEQKEARQRALLQLEAMGVKIPAKIEVTEAAVEAVKIKPKYGRLRKNKETGKELESKEKEEEDTTEWPVEEIAQEDGEEVKDSWDVDEEEFKSRKAKRVAEEKKKQVVEVAATEKEVKLFSELFLRFININIPIHRKNLNLTYFA